MEYPITDYPLSIAHSDGTPLKTDKSKLMHKLEDLQEGFTDNFSPVNVTLIDGGLLIHSLLSEMVRIKSYRQLARNLLSYICSLRGNEVHVLFDAYYQTSLKDAELKLRGGQDDIFLITGPEQAPKQSCQKLLQNGIFKDKLA